MIMSWSNCLASAELSAAVIWSTAKLFDFQGSGQGQLQGAYADQRGTVKLFDLSWQHLDTDIKENSCQV